MHIIQNTPTTLSRARTKTRMPDLQKLSVCQIHFANLIVRRLRPTFKVQTVRLRTAQITPVRQPT